MLQLLVSLFTPLSLTHSLTPLFLPFTSIRAISQHAKQVVSVFFVIFLNKMRCLFMNSCLELTRMMTSAQNSSNAPKKKLIEFRGGERRENAKIQARTGVTDHCHCCGSIILVLCFIVVSCHVQTKNFAIFLFAQ